MTKTIGAIFFVVKHRTDESRRCRGGALECRGRVWTNHYSQRKSGKGVTTWKTTQEKVSRGNAIFARYFLLPFLLLMSPLSTVESLC